MKITTEEARDTLPVGAAGVDADGTPFVITTGAKGIDGVGYLAGPYQGWIGARFNLRLPIDIRHMPEEADDDR